MVYLPVSLLGFSPYFIISLGFLTNMFFLAIMSRVDAIS
jgi:hypothetical protein